MRTWLGVAGAAVALFAAAEAADLGVAVVCKTLPVAILALGVARTGDRPGSRILAAALAIDAVADGVIEVSFLAGLGVFLVGHLLRITAFTVDVPDLRPARALPFLGIAVGASALILPSAGPLGLPIAAYAAVIATMGWRAAARADGSLAGALGLAGAASFLLSDALLGVHRFVTPLPASDVLVLGTYWAAQALIAASAVSLRDAGRSATP